MGAREIVRAVSAVLLAAAAGCGGPRPYPVAGRVVYADGEAAAELAGAEVIFTSERLRVSSSGAIDRDGRFVLTMRRTGDGTFPGEYKVVIVPAVDLLADDPRRRRPKAHLPAKYTDPRTTDLTPWPTTPPRITPDAVPSTA